MLMKRFQALRTQPRTKRAQQRTLSCLPRARLPPLPLDCLAVTEDIQLSFNVSRKGKVGKPHEFRVKFAFSQFGRDKDHYRILWRNFSILG